MEIININSISKQYDIRDIERHIVYSYIIKKSLNFSHSPFLCAYLSDLTINSDLLNKVQSLCHDSIEQIAADMELLIPISDKKVNGAFFTPDYIVDYIIETIAPRANASIIDISCGSGAFLIGVVRYMKRKYNKSIADTIRENIYGADILSYNIDRCKLLLTLLALSHNENISPNDMNLLCVDSLTHNWNLQFDAVIGNPPYVKFQDMDDSTREFLFNNFSTTKFGTYNLFFAFFEQGLNLLNENGKLGYITPNNYFTSLAAESLRAYFQSNQSIFCIVDFNATKVFDVQTYTAITFLNKQKNDFIEYSRIENNIVPKDYLNCIRLSANYYIDLSQKKWRLLCSDEQQNIFNIENAGETIGNLFNICVGIATLKDDVYSFYPIKEDDQFYYLQRDNKTFAIEKDVTRPLVKISEAKSQEDINLNTRRIIFPYIEINGKNTAIQEEDFIAKYPKCYDYFSCVRPLLDGRGKGKHIYSPFYAYGRTQGLNRKGQKLLTPTFSKYPRFLIDNNDLGFFTNGYGIYLRDNINQSSLFETKNEINSDFSFVQKILNSVVMQYYVEKTSVAIEGGYPCYQKNFIERFAIPNFNSEEISTLQSLSNIDDIDKFLVDKYHLNIPLPNLRS